MTANTRTTNFRAEVIRADPDWVRDRRRHIEYEFSNGRKFYANYDDRGAYDGTVVDGVWQDDA